MTRTAAVLACLATGVALAGSAAAGDTDARRFRLGAAPAVAVAPRPEPRAFGRALAAVARKQTTNLIIYNPAYRKIAYPMGDVPRYFGVCTDVVVRAYRAFGIDLQVLVHRSGVGSGDTNIDHRRVEVLRRFFAKAGASLPVTRNPADYQPGDLVTYHMPDGWLSKTHIAIVAAEKSPTGVPLVIHNRGWGVQSEDWLFAERITGHYRYPGPKR